MFPAKSEQEVSQPRKKCDNSSTQLCYKHNIVIGLVKNHNTLVPFYAQHDLGRGSVEGPCEEGFWGQAGPPNSQHPGSHLSFKIHQPGGWRLHSSTTSPPHGIPTHQVIKKLHAMVVFDDWQVWMPKWIVESNDGVDTWRGGIVVGDGSHSTINQM